VGAGTLGVARRHWDISFTDATLTFDYPPAAFLMMTMNGIFGVMAALGGLMFVIVVVGSVFFGKRRDAASAEASPVVNLSGPSFSTTSSTGSICPNCGR
jgi:cytochrome c oxidase subunit 1